MEVSDTLARIAADANRSARRPAAEPPSPSLSRGDNRVK